MINASDHLSLIQRYCDAFERGDVDRLDELVHPDVIDHNAFDEQSSGIDGYREFFKVWNIAFPDLRMSLDLTVSEDDLIAYRWTASGTHRGPYHGHPPTGRSVRFSAIAVNRIRDGLIAEEWIEIDNLGLLRQIGAVRQAK